jgi:prepilin-type N-terminal cleavage/methylation domain-containing protein
MKLFVNKKGITLIEVLISVVILSGGLIVVYQPLLKSLGVLSYLEQRSEASRMANEFLWKLQREATQSGNVPTEGAAGELLGRSRAYQFRIDMRDVVNSERLLEAKLAISWRSGGKKRQIQRVTYVSVRAA